MTWKREPKPLQDFEDLPDKRPVRIKTIQSKSKPMDLLIGNEIIIKKEN